MKNKKTATLLAFFFGGIGLHHFYLGNKLKGIIYLLFVWTLIPVFLGFVDFMKLVKMSDSEFNNFYNLANILVNSTLSSFKYNKIDNILKNYPDKIIDDENYIDNLLKTNKNANQIIYEKVGSFLYDLLKKNKFEIKEKIETFLNDNLYLDRDVFNEMYAKTQFSLLVEDCLSDESLDPNEINLLHSKAIELNIVEYKSEDKIRKDYRYYIRNWEFDNGIINPIESDFILNSNESCLFSCDAEVFEYKDVISRISHAGPSVRIKLMKGLSYNMGSSSVKINKDTVKLSKGIGKLNITTKRILFKANQKVSNVLISQIVDLEPFTDGILIYKSSGNPIFIKYSSVEDLYQSINGSIRLSQSK
jgi:TM2 domain-containing membrane protein YozV